MGLNLPSPSINGTTRGTSRVQCRKLILGYAIALGTQYLRNGVGLRIGITEDWIRNPFMITTTSINEDLSIKITWIIAGNIRRWRSKSSHWKKNVRLICGQEKIKTTRAFRYSGDFFLPSTTIYLYDSWLIRYEHFMSFNLTKSPT